MRRIPILVGVWLGLAVQATPAEKDAVPRAQGLRPGLVFMFFDDGGFARPGSHGLDARIKSHGVLSEIASHGVDARIDLDMQGIDGFSQLWIGRLRFPVDGEVTFSAEADDGVRLYLGDQCVIDGWGKDRPRAGKARAAAGQMLPIRVEYFQSGGESYLRLSWQWPGHAREPVPDAAFWHDGEHAKRGADVAAGKVQVAPGNAPNVISVPTGSEEFKTSIYGHSPRGEPSCEAGRDVERPIRLRPGAHLFVDDFLVAQASHVRRRVNPPRRDPAIGNPLITGKEDRCVGPYLTVIRDAATGRFRIWYNVYKEKHKDGTARFATMESEDGIRWLRPARVLEDPGPINFGSSVIDEGPDFPEPDRRFKLAWWAEGGLKIAVSRDGLDWSMFKPWPVVRHNHDINNLFYDPLRRRYVATISVYTTGPTWTGQRRTTMQTTSRDLIAWEKPWYVLTADDRVDEGQTQFYAMSGYLARGDLLLGLVKVLRDDLRAPDTPDGAFGVGYTTLAWTRDGEHWVRDPAAFFEPDPDPNAWDHAHAWLDFQLPVGDRVHLYYGGYRYGHKMDRWEGRQIGLVRIERDRYVSRDADGSGGTLTTPPVVLEGARMTLNADVWGEIRVRLLDTRGGPLPGFDADQCRPMRGDSLAHEVAWGDAPAALPDRPVRVEFLLRDARLYRFDLVVCPD